MNLDLSDRQLEILAMYASGYTGPQISEKLYLSLHTVRNYMKLARKKCGAKSVPQLVAWCVNAQLLEIRADGTVKVLNVK